MAIDLKMTFFDIFHPIGNIHSYQTKKRPKENVQWFKKYDGKCFSTQNEINIDFDRV